MTSPRDASPIASSDAPALTLASASPRRLALLAQIGVRPARVVSPNIDETPLPDETPKALALRLAHAKAAAAHAPGALTLAADTVVSVGRRILPKAETEAEARLCLARLSGRTHRVVTAVALALPEGRIRARLGEAQVRLKRLTDAEIAAYLESGEWRGKAGGYAIQGRAATLILEIAGSYSAIVGLPLYETATLLEGAGLRVRG